ncbi:MAG: PVC-type heme-binding CxxCH protein, partial [Planctomycetota bacterium]
MIRFFICSWILFSCVVMNAENGENDPPFRFYPNERIAFVGGSAAERMNLFGHLETMLHFSHSDLKLQIRNFGWPADQVDNQQRPNNYTRIDNPLNVFSPQTFVCFFGFNEHFAGDDAGELKVFRKNYANWILQTKKEFSNSDYTPRFILVGPAAIEPSKNALLPDANLRNAILKKYNGEIARLANDLGIPFVNLFAKSKAKFASQEGLQVTVNGVHLNDLGDRFVARKIYGAIQGNWKRPENSRYEKIRKFVNDKSWLHLQDYRMLNGWYVYGGRRTWDKQTFPVEYRKIREMVAIRDEYIWDLAAGRPVSEQPDDSATTKVFTPETMFGTRDDAFREMREPRTLVYPTPEESIEQMTMPDGMEVQLFASEREFPELANPTQMTFDSKGRLWVSCMINYPQWLPGSAKPGDKLLIFEDTDNDGKADVCKTFWDKLICPTGFEFYKDGVLVIDEPRILYITDTDGDDRGDSSVQLIDGIATDDTHHAMGAWEWSHGGLLYMLEGIQMSTTMETPWGPFRMKGPSGGYVLDPLSMKFRHFKTPGYGNPWCMVFDRWGMGIVGDGTNAQQHWTSPLSGYPVGPRKTLRPNFNNEGMRPAVGNEFLFSRHLPKEMQGQFTYACVINMHGLPRFEVDDEEGAAGFKGQRIDDLLASTDNFFRPVDPQIGPDGALWFGDWCNALIGHMQYSQRDPNRDHQHGRIYRLVNKNKPLLEPELQFDKSIPDLLEQLKSYELRTRYRARRELRRREKSRVLQAVSKWIESTDDPEVLCEAMWLQESFRSVESSLIDRILQSDDFHARSAAVHTVTNEIERYSNSMAVFEQAIKDSHPRVRLEAVRGLSFVQSKDALEVALRVLDMPMD